MEMITVSAAEFQRNFERYQDEALKQPVSITRNGRDCVALRVGDLSDADLAAIAATEMDPRHNHLDDELK